MLLMLLRLFSGLFVSQHDLNCTLMGDEDQASLTVQRCLAGVDKSDLFSTGHAGEQVL